jgi:hypothetical protein
MGGRQVAKISLVAMDILGMLRLTTSRTNGGVSWGAMEGGLAGRSLIVLH